MLSCNDCSHLLSQLVHHDIFLSRDRQHVYCVSTVVDGSQRGVRHGDTVFGISIEVYAARFLYVYTNDAVVS